MKIENVKKLDLILENCEIITFSGDEIICFELSEEMIALENGFSPTRTKISISRMARRNEPTLSEIFGFIGFPEEDDGTPITRNNFERLIEVSDITHLRFYFNDDEEPVCLIIPYDEDPNSDLIIEQRNERSYLDSVGNLNISITVNPIYLNVPNIL